MMVSEWLWRIAAVLITLNSNSHSYIWYQGEQGTKKRVLLATGYTFKTPIFFIYYLLKSESKIRSKGQ